MFAHRSTATVFGSRRRGYSAEVSASGKRSLMQVEPARLVELAGSSERVLDAMRQDWADAVDELAEACVALGDATGTANLAASYADALADADEVLTSLAGALELGVAGLVDAARDALRADDIGRRRARPCHPPAGRGAVRDHAGTGRSLTVPANPWELRADVRPLEAAAQRWTEVSALVSRRGDELVDAARRATEGWDAASAESYEQHRKQVLAHLDRFTSLADRIADCLRASATLMTSSQKDLDRAWTTVAAVPHEVVGESRHLVFKPSEDEDRGKVTRGQAETDDIRQRLTVRARPGERPAPVGPRRAGHGAHRAAVAHRGQLRGVRRARGRGVGSRHDRTAVHLGAGRGPGRCLRAAAGGPGLGVRPRPARGSPRLG